MRHNCAGIDSNKIDTWTLRVGLMSTHQAPSLCALPSREASNLGRHRSAERQPATCCRVRHSLSSNSCDTFREFLTLGQRLEYSGAARHQRAKTRTVFPSCAQRPILHPNSLSDRFCPEACRVGR